MLSRCFLDFSVSVGAFVIGLSNLFLFLFAYILMLESVSPKLVMFMDIEFRWIYLLLRTPGPVPFGTCICSTVETSDTRYRLDILPVCDIITGLDIFTESDISPDIGFHRASATGVACRQGTLTPPDTWSCPPLGLASVLMLRPISPELVLFLDFWVSNIPRYFCFFAFLVTSVLHILHKTRNI